MNENEIEEAFLEWQLTLGNEQQQKVEYHEFDRSLRTVFLKREEGFDLDQVKTLEAQLRENEKALRVGTLMDR